jgi:hypothetical protein
MYICSGELQTSWEDDTSGIFRQWEFIMEEFPKLNVYVSLKYLFEPCSKWNDWVVWDFLWKWLTILMKWFVCFEVNLCMSGCFPSIHEFAFFSFFIGTFFFHNRVVADFEPICIETNRSELICIETKGCKLTGCRLPNEHSRCYCGLKRKK